MIKVRKFMLLAMFMFLAGCFLFIPQSFGGDVVVIANPDVPVDSLSASHLKQIFLGKKKAWSNGTSIQFFSSKNSDLKKTFLKAYIGKSESQFKTYWKKQVFTGKGKMPEAMESDQTMVEKISSTAGGIGFVPAGFDTGNAKIISIN